MPNNDMYPLLTEHFLSEGSDLEIQTSFRMLLHDLDHIFYIEEGEIEIFALEPKGDFVEKMGGFIEEAVAANQSFLGDVLEGPLSFIRTVPKGRFLFPFPLVGETKDLKVLAIASEHAKLKRVPTKAFRDFVSKSAETQEELATLLANWTLEVSSTFVDAPVSHVNREIKKGIKYDIPQDFLISAPQKKGLEVRDAVCWVNLSEGDLRLMGYRSIVVNPGSPRLPITPKTYYRALENVKLESLRCIDVVKDGSYWDGLVFFHKNVLAYLKEYKVFRAEDIKHRYDLQEQLKSSNLDTTLRSMGAVLETPKAIDFPAGDDQVLKACLVIGFYTDVAFVAPTVKIGGLNLEDHIYEVALASRAQHRRVLLKDKWWNDEGAPLLAFYKEGNKPLALVPNLVGKYEIVDPETRQRTLVTPEVAKTISPVSYMFYRSFPAGKMSAFKVLQFVIKRRWRDIATIVMIGGLGAFIGLFSPYASKILFDDVIPMSNTFLLLQIVCAMLIMNLCSVAFSLTRQYTVLRMEGMLDHDLQVALWDRVFSLPAKFFRNYSVGDLIQRVNSVGTMRQMLTGSVMSSLLSGLFSIVYGIGMFYISPMLGTVGIIFVFLGLSISAFGIYKNIGYQRVLLQIGAELNTNVLQTISGISKVRTSDTEDRFFASWGQKFEKSERLSLLSMNVSTLVGLVKSLLPILTQATIFTIVVNSLEVTQLQQRNNPNSIIQPTMTVGIFMAFSSMYGSFSSAMYSFFGTAVSLVKIVPLWERNRPILEAVTESGIGKFKPGRVAGNITIDSVTFRYTDDGPTILKDLSMEIQAGEYIAIVGPSGCGKTTLMRLLIGFEQAESGGLYFDGKSVETLDLKELRRQMGVVLQTSSIFDGSIKENIMASGNFTDEEILDAIERAGFTKDLAQLPMGLHTVLTNGGGALSGGQRQRLLIARSIIGTPRILIFDEATSALDNVTQKIVTDNLDSMNMTRIVIAHRLSTILGADKVYVMDGGGIIESGSIDQLMAKNGRFAKMRKRQML
jgi:NHLM bacteriocin system ABC transporter ATP-binding protein